jgi:guanine nucleotide-binding protein G(I)/G(S)/G(T) subunit beta-1
MIVWDPMTANKEYAVTLRSSWVMTCAYSPSKRLIAAGGLDNTCSIYDLQDIDAAMSSMKSGIPDIQPKRELVGHIGFIAGARFLSDKEMITCSGDTTSILWDIDRGLPKMTFKGHTADVMNIALLTDRSTPGSATSFVTVGCDATSRIWDIRTGKCTRIFVGHDSDINAVDAFPSGEAFATGSDDHSCRLYDLRADRELMRYANTDMAACVTSVSFSRSGRALFAAYDDTNVIAWDVLRAEQSGVLAAHEERVSSLAVSPDGNALATASWDSMAKIWA